MANHHCRSRRSPLTVVLAVGLLFGVFVYYRNTDSGQDFVSISSGRPPRRSSTADLEEAAAASRPSRRAAVDVPHHQIGVVGSTGSLPDDGRRTAAAFASADVLPSQPQNAPIVPGLGAKDRATADTSGSNDTRLLWARIVDGRSRTSNATSGGDAQRPVFGEPTSLASASSGPVARVDPDRNFIPPRCPLEFNITDDQDAWFRTSVVQRSPVGPGNQPPPSAFRDEILVLTPISNVDRHLHRYFENLCSLAYPHRLLSVVLGEDSSLDKTFQTATALADDLRPYFRRLDVIRLPDSTSRRTGNARHEPSYQFVRRRHMARARNRLLSYGLSVAGPTVRWVLWIDSDVRHIPVDLVRHMLAANRSVVVPNCLWRQDNGQTATFDRNTWRETNQSLAELRAMKSDELKLEGYSPTSRRFLNDLKAEGDLVAIDGVGGCVLLVDADLHRDGLVFPSFVFDHHIETEGLAKMAAKMGVQMYGLPSVNVIHW